MVAASEDTCIGRFVEQHRCGIAHEHWICWVASQAYDEGSIPFTRSSENIILRLSALAISSAPPKIVS